MSMVPTSLMGSLAATPLAQSKGSDVDKARHDTATQQRETSAAEHANAAAGIGRTEEDSQTDERDADGRRPWEFPAKTPDEETKSDASSTPPRSKDPTGQSGQKLDLSG